MFESEERRMAERIKDYIKKEEPPQYYYIMLRNGRILNIDDYRDMLSDGRIKPQDAYVDFDIKWIYSSGASFHYSFLVGFNILLVAYLSKLGFYYGGNVLGYYYREYVFPATGLKYVAAAEDYREYDFYRGYFISREKYLTIELVNLDTVVNNTNLRKIVFEVVGDKIISGEKKLTEEEYDKISDMFSSQRLFAGYDFNGALDVIHDYYYNNNKSLAKEVARIAMDYDRIFNPYRVCYETKTWKEIDCSTIT